MLAATVEAVTLQFHPDWPFRGGTVIDSMAADGLYRSQFVTGVSDGGLTAYPGGDRWHWESRLFAGRYDDGPVRFDTDVEALVLDPCFADTDIETTARTLGCPIEFHRGFRARPDSIDPAFRGTHITQLADSLSPELTPAVIGTAACSAAHPPQAIKHLWHCLAHFGRTGEVVDET